jgi:hypothetical protein
MNVNFEQFIVDPAGDEPEEWPTKRVSNGDTSTWGQVIERTEERKGHIEALAPGPWWLARDHSIRNKASE